MILRVLGSGNGVPTAERGCPGFLLRAAGETVLVDPGPGALVAAARSGAGPAAISVVLVTHLHLDHCHDIPALLFALHSRSAGRTAPLRIAGPVGLARWMETWRATWGRWIEPAGWTLEVAETSPGAGGVGDLLLEAVEVPHGVSDPRTAEPLPSLGWRIRERPDGPVLAFSGDTGEGFGAAEAGRDADLFVLECTLPSGEGGTRHLDGAGAGRVATAARCRRLLLVHFAPGTDSRDALAQAQGAFAGAVTLAEDGMEVEV